MEKIDDLDRKILQIITQNARIPFKEVADQCGVSRAAVHQRVQRMYDIGVIVGSGYIVNPKMLGYQLCVYIGITLEKGSMYRAVTKELQKIPEIVESQFTLGGFSMLIKLYAKDDAHLMHLLNDKIQEIPGVANTETLTSLEQPIRRGLPINLD
ncbi:MAG: AsnC family transcriptional regulator [Paludibacteraceae bacterium]|nr:AsnC family transcriptional regulator [Paludibacteraceae bacterium]